MNEFAIPCSLAVGCLFFLIAFVFYFKDDYSRYTHPLYEKRTDELEAEIKQRERDILKSHNLDVENMAEIDSFFWNSREVWMDLPSDMIPNFASLDDYEALSSDNQSVVRTHWFPLRAYFSSKVQLRAIRQSLSYRFRFLIIEFFTPVFVGVLSLIGAGWKIINLKNGSPEALVF